MAKKAKKPSKMEAALLAKVNKSLGSTPAKKKAATPATPKATQPQGTGLLVRQGISIYDTDVAKINATRAYLMQRGLNCTASGVIRLALRQMDTGEDLVAAFHQMQLEDKRRN